MHSLTYVLSVEYQYLNWAHLSAVNYLIHQITRKLVSYLDSCSSWNYSKYYNTHMFSSCLYLRFHLIHNKVMDSIVFRFICFIECQILIHITQIVITTCGSIHQTLEACRAEPLRSKDKKLTLQSYTLAWYGSSAVMKLRFWDPWENLHLGIHRHITNLWI